MFQHGDTEVVTPTPLLVNDKVNVQDELPLRDVAQQVRPDVALSTPPRQQCACSRWREGLEAEVVPRPLDHSLPGSVHTMSMIKFKGRLSFRQYLPAKPIKWGIKMWALCESDTGYAYNMQVYTGKMEGQEKGLTHRVCLNLLVPVLGTNFRVYMDNLYTSVGLLTDLRVRDILVCGTVRTNWKGLPAALLPKNVKLRLPKRPLQTHTGAKRPTYYRTSTINSDVFVFSTTCVGIKTNSYISQLQFQLLSNVYLTDNS